MQPLVCVISSETRVCFMQNPQHDITWLQEKYDGGGGGGWKLKWTLNLKNDTLKPYTASKNDILKLLEPPPPIFLVVLTLRYKFNIWIFTVSKEFHNINVPTIGF